MRALRAFVSTALGPPGLGGSRPRPRTRPAGGGWELGHRPEEFRSLGRLSTSELCSLPMATAARAAEERRARRSPLRRRDDRAGAGDRDGDATPSVGAAAGPTRPAHSGAPAEGDGTPYLGDRRAKRRSAAARRVRPRSLGDPKGRRWRAPSFSRASGRRAAPLSLTRSGAASSLLPGRGLAAPGARGRQFRVGGHPAPPSSDTHHRAPAPGRAGRV